MVVLIVMTMCRDDFEIVPSDEYIIIIPRLLSAFMMHLNVEPDIRNGLKLMKYAVNHPSAFKHFPCGHDCEDGHLGGA